MNKQQRLRPNVYGNSECTGGEWDLTVGEVYGYRTWNVDKRGRLRSPSQNFIWKPGVNTAFDRDEHKGSAYPPEGFYAYYDAPTFNGEVVGVIKATGYVSEGTRGFTAEHAEVVALVDNSIGFTNPLVKPFAKFYARNTWDSLVGIGIPAGLVSILLGVFGVPMLAIPPQLWVLGSIFVAISILTGFICHATWRAEKTVDAVGSATYLKELRNPIKKYSLRELYPNAKFYRTKARLMSAYGDIIEDSRPGAEPAVKVTPEDETFWQ